MFQTARCQHHSLDHPSYASTTFFGHCDGWQTSRIAPPKLSAVVGVESYRAYTHFRDRPISDGPGHRPHLLSLKLAHVGQPA
jgi:hypothetical protein